MKLDKSLLVNAELKDGTQVTGGVCEFTSMDGKETKVLMLHPNQDGLATVSEVKADSCKPCFDSWAWMRSWIEAYERAHPEIEQGGIMNWINNQPMTCG